MLIAGWGEDAKFLGHIGIVKCSNCKNTGPMGMIEVAKKVTLYFVRVAKWQKRYYVVCPICEAGSEVDVETKDQLLRQSVELPDVESTVAIWNAIDARVGAIGDSGRKLFPADFENMLREIQKTYPEQYVTYVASCYWGWLADPDKPE